MASNNISFLNFIEKLLSETNTGWLVVDDNRKIINFNGAYHQFHNLFNESRLDIETVLRDGDFKSFPDSFISNLKRVLNRETEKVKLQIDYLGSLTLSFSISMVYISSDEDNFEGALIMVQKKESRSATTRKPENEDFYKILINTSTSVYQLTDAALVFTYTSGAIEEILGYTAAEVLGKNAIELVHPDDKEHVRDWLINIRRQPEKLLTAEYRIKNKQGVYIWVENNARNMLSDASIKAIVMSFRNIQTKKVADDALIHAEQRLSLLLNNTEESFILLNSRLRIVTYNKAAQERSPFFYNVELQSGISVLDLISKNEIAEYISLFEQVFKGKEIERETKFVDANKVAHVYSHTFRPLFNSQEDIHGVFITSTEITERKKLTEEVALHSDRLKTAQKIARLGYVEFDPATKNFFCSELFYEILGVPELLDNCRQLSLLRNMVHPDDKELVKKEIQDAIVHGKDFNLEFRFNSKDGLTKVILAMGGSEKDEFGKTVKLRVTLQDITDSKMAILALQTLESKFKSLFENSIDGVILSKEDGDIVSANPAVCKMLGYAHSELINVKSHDLLDIDSSLVANMAQVQKDTGSYIGELFLKHKKGYYVPVEVTSVLMKDGNGNCYLSTIIRDITDKKKIEGEQKALTEELLKNNQDLQQFSFITSHNLRAPVANLLSLLSLYNKDNPLDEFNQLLIEKFEEATQQLNQTLNDLVNVLVIKSNPNIERETVSFTDVFIEVKKNVDNLLYLQKGSIKANFSQVDQIQYSRIHLESIFLNMLSNAIRYSSPDRNPEIKITSYKTEDWVIVEFEDNGLGMDLNRYRDRLFGLYQRFHGHKEGKGLGLYMTRSQVTAMGGKIEVESEPGVGTKFKIFFKLQD
ncbi:PAS domain-containing sensor histidine kinase [Segetibacter aerophilus]|nr:PAS domain S-box protein [Segetibacter aerophilus]